MYSDEWLKQGFKSGPVMKVSDVVYYKIWSDNYGSVIGVGIDFEIDNDFHYELLISDWNRFLAEVLNDTNPACSSKVFSEYLYNCKNYFTFQEDLKSKGIKYKKIAFYDIDY